MTKFIPLGRRVLLKEIPLPHSPVLLPDGAKNPNGAVRFTVLAIGPEVNRQNFPLNEGDTVQIVAHAGTMAGVCPVQRILSLNDCDINVIVREEVE